MSCPQNHFRSAFGLLLLLAAILLSPAAFAETNNVLAGPTTVQPTNPASPAAVSANVTDTNLPSLANRRTDASNSGGTNSIATSPDLNAALPNVAGSMFRVLGMLTLVIALFLGGVWFFRNWQRLTIHRGNAPKLNVLETRSLGGRHAIFVVGYENERFLISSSPAGINMLTHLSPAEESSSTPAHPATPPTSFATTLAQMLKGKQP